MFVCGADSQGGLGFMLQQALQNALRRRRTAPSRWSASSPRCWSTATILPSPSPPSRSARSTTEEQAERLRLENGWSVVKDAGRGWRRVVPSPLPIEVIEWEAIRALLDAAA